VRGSAGEGPAGWATLAAVAVAAVAFHLPLRHASYVQDDHVAVETNPIVARGDLREILSTSYWAGARGEDRSLYRPLTVLSFAFERRLRGDADPRLSRAVNLAAHLGVTLVLYALAVRLGSGRRAAATATLVFAVHPVHVEAVAGIVGRAELLAALGGLGSLLILTFTGGWAPWGAALALGLALGAKETALGVPILMLVLQLGVRPPDGPHGARLLHRLGALAPSIAVVLAYLAVRAWVLETAFALQQPHPADNFLVLSPGPERAATALGILARAAAVLIAPIVLSADYSGHVIEPESGLLRGRPLAGLALLAALVVTVVRPWLVQRSACPRAHHTAFAAALFLVPYLVTGNLLVLVGTIFAERLLYLPSAGFCLLVGLLVERLGGAPRRRLVVAAAVVALVGAFGARTSARCREWRDDGTLFAAAARAQPRSPRAWFVLGLRAADRGDDARALELFSRVIELWPEHVPARFQKAMAHARRGELAEAEPPFQEALRLNPQDATTRLNYGIALNRQGRWVEAESMLRKALVLDPGSARAWAELGNVRFNAGRYAGALGPYRRAIALGRADLRERLDEARERAGPAADDPRER
jgi:Tfp pilus assembly protein PilF